MSRLNIPAMRFAFRLGAVLVCCLACGSESECRSTTTAGRMASRVIGMHEWPPGVIDRALQVDVWPDRIDLEVRLGLSAPTVLEELKSRLEDDSLIADLPEQRIEQLRDLVLTELARVIELRIDGVPVSFTPVGSELSSKHHILFFCYFEAHCQIVDRPVEIVIHDRSFPKLENQLRLALRPRRTKRLRSNVEPLVIRSDRIMLNELPSDIQKDARRIRAIVAPSDYEAPSRGVAEVATTPPTSVSSEVARDPIPDAELPPQVSEEAAKGPDPVASDRMMDRDQSFSRLDSANVTWAQGVLIALALLFIVSGIWMWQTQSRRRNSQTSPNR